MPINSQGTIQSAMAALGSGRTDKAEALYQALVVDHPDLFGTHMVGGVIAANQLKRDIAIERFQKAMAIDSRNPAVHNWLSVMLRETGNSASALTHAETANRLRPNEPEILCNLGLCLFEVGEFTQAIEQFQKAVSLRPSDPMLHAGLGKCYQAVGRNLDAVQQFEVAAKIAPDFVGLLKLGDLLSTLGRHHEATDAYRRAIELRPNSAHAHVLMSRTLSDLLMHDEAKVHLDLAESLDPQLSDVYLRRAYMLQMMGEFKEAESQFEKSISINAGEGVAYYGIVSAKKLTEADRPLIARLNEALDLPGITSDDRSHLHFSLGKILDNLGDYGGAMTEYDEANRVTWEANLRSRPFDPDRLVRDVDARIATFSREFFEQWRGGSESDKPIFIVGMPRSGTTLVEQILSCNPDVVAGGELSFWVLAENRTVDLSNRIFRSSTLKTTIAEYLDVVNTFSGDKSHVTDKNPANCLVLGLIHSAFPNAKIIHTRRNPVDTALSIYTTPMRTPPDFGCIKENIVFFTKQYLRLMVHWRATLPSDRFLEIDYEELTSNGEDSARRLSDFCKLNWSDACLHPESNQRAVRTPSFWQVRQPLYTSSINRWKKYEQWLGPFEELLNLK